MAKKAPSPERLRLIEEHADALVELLKAEEDEFLACESNQDPFSKETNSANWQADKARQVAGRLLSAAKADGLEGCEFCFN